MWPRSRSRRAPGDPPRNMRPGLSAAARAALDDWLAKWLLGSPEAQDRAVLLTAALDIDLPSGRSDGTCLWRGQVVKGWVSPGCFPSPGPAGVGRVRFRSRCQGAAPAAQRGRTTLTPVRTAQTCRRAGGVVSARGVLSCAG